MKKLMYLLPLILLITACGEQGPKVTSLTVVGIDQMKFTVKSNDIEGVKPGKQTSGTKYDELYILDEIEAKAGQTLTIKFENNSNLPVQSMGHNFVLLKKDADVQTFVNASMGDAADDYIADDMQNQIIAQTAMLGGGESETLEIEIPSEPGEYTFVCTFPGHYASGMQGIIRVKA